MSRVTAIFLGMASLMIVFTLQTDSVDPDEMWHYAAFHLGIHFLPKYLFRGFQYIKG